MWVGTCMRCRNVRRGAACASAQHAQLRCVGGGAPATQATEAEGLGRLASRPMAPAALPSWHAMQREMPEGRGAHAPHTLTTMPSAPVVQLYALERDHCPAAPLWHGPTPTTPAHPPAGCKQPRPRTLLAPTGYGPACVRVPCDAVPSTPTCHCALSHTHTPSPCMHARAPCPQATHTSRPPPPPPPVLVPACATSHQHRLNPTHSWLSRPGLSQAVQQPSLSSSTGAAPCRPTPPQREPTRGAIALGRPSWPAVRGDRGPARPARRWVAQWADQAEDPRVAATGVGAGWAGGVGARGCGVTGVAWDWAPIISAQCWWCRLSS